MVFEAASMGCQLNQQNKKSLLRVAYLSMEPKTGLKNLAEQLDGHLVTHVILAFARVDPIRGTLVLNKPEDKFYLSQVKSFKQKYPHLRLLISVNDEPAADPNNIRDSNSRNTSSVVTTTTTTMPADRRSLINDGQGDDSSSAKNGDNLSMNDKFSNQVENRRASSGDERVQTGPSDLHHLHNVASSLVHSGAFNKLVQSTQLRQKFARSAMEFLKYYSLDGIDIDWEFPNFPHYFGINREYEKTGLTKLMMELRSAIVEDFFDRQVAEQYQMNNQNHANHGQNHNSHHNNNNQHRSINEPVVKPHLLTLAIGAQDNILRFSYELKLLSNLCDWFNVMSYDYYMFKAYSPFTGPNAPLKPIVEPFVPVLGKLSFQSTLNKLLSEDLDREKIVMGIPTYARAYRLLFKNSHPAPLTLAYGSRSGSYSSEYLSYEEVCQMLTRPETIVDFDKRARVPYLLTDDGYTWVSYENEQSVKEKVSVILENQLGGYMTWNLNSDFFQQQRSDQSDINQDASQSNNETNFPLHRALFVAAALSASTC